MNFLNKFYHVPTKKRAFLFIHRNLNCKKNFFFLYQCYGFIRIKSRDFFSSIFNCADRIDSWDDSCVMYPWDCKRKVFDYCRSGGRNDDDLCRRCLPSLWAVSDGASTAAMALSATNQNYNLKKRVSVFWHRFACCFQCWRWCKKVNK